MPFGIVSDDVFESMIQNPKKQDSPKPDLASIIDIKSPGRREGDVEVPMPVKKLIGETGISDRKESLELAKFFDISNSSVDSYRVGATSANTRNEKNPELESHIKKAKHRISKRAAGKLSKALGKLDDEKLDECTAVELSAVARNMAAIVHQFDPEPEDKNTGPQVQFNLYAPKMITEQHFDVVAARE